MTLCLQRMSKNHAKMTTPYDASGTDSCRGTRADRNTLILDSLSIYRDQYFCRGLTRLRWCIMMVWYGQNSRKDAME